jgi:hypothetical protein
MVQVTARKLNLQQHFKPYFNERLTSPPIMTLDKNPSIAGQWVNDTGPAVNQNPSPQKECWIQVRLPARKLHMHEMSTFFAVRNPCCTYMHQARQSMQEYGILLGSRCTHEHPSQLSYHAQGEAAGHPQEMT